MKLVELSDLFSVSYGNKYDLNKMVFSDSNGIAFINRTGINNGVVQYVQPYNGVEPFPANSLTIALGGSVLSTFLQIKPFYTGQNVAVALPREPMEIAELLYYAVAIMANRFRYSTCGREANRTFRTLLIPERSEIPSWVYDIDVNMYEGADAPASKSAPPDLDSAQWKTFTYEQLFTIERGKGPRIKDLNGQGNTPFITSIDGNNGRNNVTTMNPCHQGNVIGVNRNGSVAEAFYQPVPFCSTEDVHIFIPKFELNPYRAMFLCTLIKQEKYRFGYGRKWGIERMKKLKFVCLSIKMEILTGCIWKITSNPYHLVQ